MTAAVAAYNVQSQQYILYFAMGSNKWAILLNWLTLSMPRPPALLLQMNCDFWVDLRLVHREHGLYSAITSDASMVV